MLCPQQDWALHCLGAERRPPGATGQDGVSLSSLEASEAAGTSMGGCPAFGFELNFS